MSCEIKTWNAHVHEQGDARTLHVMGEGECTTTGHQLRLVRTDEGIVDDPTLVVLELEMDEPEGRPAEVTPQTVEGFFSIGSDPATKVEIRGAATASFPIDS
jgi:hypothetical protein